MKIVIIGTLASSFYGFRSELIKSLVKENHEVYAFTSDKAEIDLDKIRALGANPISYNLNRGGLNPINDIRVTFTLATKIKDLKPDIVFSYFSKPVIFGTLAARLAKVPKIVGMLEGLGYAFTEQPEGFTIKAKLIQNIQICLYKLSLPMLNSLILLNHDDPKDLLEQNSIKVKSLYILGGIGLNLKDYPFQPIPNPPIKFIFIARLLKEKGIFEFLTAAMEVKKLYPEVQFTVLGDIDESNPGGLNKRDLDNIISLGIINYPGHVNNVSEWITDSHVFVLPSYREGFPRSTQEAMAIGRPVITTNAPGCRETVKNGINGFIISKFSSLELIDKMIYFIENPSQVSVMGKESYRIAQKEFDAEVINKRLINILTS